MEDFPSHMILPDELEFRPSDVEPLKLGVWSTCAIEKDRIYGPFVGEKKKLSAVVDHTYSWEILGPKGRRIYCIDAINPLKSNWMRYVKSARNYEEQNMIASQEDRSIFYRTLKKIPKGKELLCWYTEIPASKPVPNQVKSRTRDDNDTRIDDHEDINKELTKSSNVDGIVTDDMIPIKHIHGNDHMFCLGLSNSLQQVISSPEYPVIDTKHKEPVVRLIPLSAEIKLKVHLDLDIHLDADFKLMDDLLPEEENNYPRSQLSDNTTHQLDKQDAPGNTCQQQFDDHEAPNTGIMSDQCNTPDNTDTNSKIDSTQSNPFSETDNATILFPTATESLGSNQDYPLESPSVLSAKSNSEIDKPIHEEALPQSNNTPPESPLGSESEMPLKQLSNSEHEIVSKALSQKDSVGSSTLKQQLSHESKSEGRPSEERLSDERLSEERLSEERLSDERLSDERLSKERLSEERLSDERQADERLSKERLSEERLSDERQADERLSGESLPEEHISDERLPDKSLSDECLSGERQSKEHLSDERLPDERLSDEHLSEEHLSDEHLPDESLSGEHLPGKRQTDDLDKLNGYDNNMPLEKEVLPTQQNTGQVPIQTTTNTINNENISQPNDNAVGTSIVGPRSQMKKVKKLKHKCPQCSKAFRKNVHLKIHISRMHTKRERKVTQYVARKREKILTRSLTYKVQVTDSESYTKPVHVSPKVFPRMPELDEARVTNTNETHLTSDLNQNETHPTSGNVLLLQNENHIDLPTSVVRPGPSSMHVYHQRKNRKILPKPYSKPQHTTVGVNVCKYCKRTFRYASWLDRHMVTHRKQAIRKSSHSFKDKISKAKFQIEHASTHPQFFEGPQPYEQLQIDQTPTAMPAGMNIKLHESENPSSINTPNHQHDQVTPTEKDIYDYDSISEDKADMSESVSTETSSTDKKSGTHTCSICGKHFTTKKNCRRHRRLIHNILVRPERTKLPYANYVVEKQYPSVRGSNSNSHEKKVPTTILKKAKPIRKLLSNPTSKPISVRMFDPSQMQVSSIQQIIPNRQKKLQWTTSSNRTGPPPSSMKGGSAKESIHKRLLHQDTLFNSIAKPHPWNNKLKPEPFIPKSHTAKTGAAPSLDGVSDKNSRACTQDEHSTTNDVNTPIDFSSTNTIQTDCADLKKIEPIPISSTEPISMELLAKQPRLDASIFKQPVQLVFGKDQIKQPTHSWFEPQQNSTLPTYLQRKLVETPSTKVAQTRNTPSERTQSTIYRPILPKPDPIPMPEVTKLTVDKKELEHKTDMSRYIAKKVFSCTACSLIFYSFHELEQHVSVHADDWPYRCEFCIQLFQKPQDLVFHRKNHHLTGKIHVCKICKRKFASKKLLEKHRLDCLGTKSVESKDPPETAKICTTLSSNPLPLSKRSQGICKPEAACSHPVFQASTTYRCTKCSKQFTETMEFHSHIMDCALTVTPSLSSA